MLMTHLPLPQLTNTTVGPVKEDTLVEHQDYLKEKV